MPSPSKGQKQQDETRSGSLDREAVESNVAPPVEDFHPEKAVRSRKIYPNGDTDRTGE